MKILILGGTIFLGPHLIEAALARGHQITIFNRGQHSHDGYPEVEKLRGDRSRDVEALHGRRWEALIDTCGYVPGVVRKSAQLLADAVEHYTFISSCSVYANFNLAATGENAPVSTITPEQVNEAETIDTGERTTAVTYGKMYGALKALCERAAEEALPGRVLNERAGLLVGSYDYNGIFLVNNDKAITAGLTFRPLSETIKDALAWDATRPSNIERRAGLKLARERELLKKLLPTAE